MEPQIELAKTRDFGEVIGDTFMFIKQNFKELLKNYFIFCGIFMVFGCVAFAMSQVRMMKIMNEVNIEGPRTFSSISGIWGSYTTMIVVGISGYCAGITTILCYLAIYKQKGNLKPTSEEIWNFFKYYYLRVLLASIVMVLLLSFAYALCLIPGVWLFPIFGLIYPIMIMENTGFGFAFSRSFQLIKDNWWITAGSLFVIWLIAYIMSMVFTIPASAANLASAFITPGKMQNLSLGSIIFSAIMQQLAQLMFIIPTIGICLLYYNLVETKEGSSLMDRISKFGEHNPQTGFPNEEY